MKKTLIAASIAALATAGSAQAVELYKSDTASFSTYGKLQLELQNFDGENNVQNNGSRLGFSGTQTLDSGLEAFANFEFRFNPGARNSSDVAGEIASLDLKGEDHFDIRNSYFGVRGGFGSIQAGNFDSITYQYVTGIADVMENAGYASLDGGAQNGQGHTIGYESPELLGGLTLALGVKHYSSSDSANNPVFNSTSGDEIWNVQVAAAYAITDELKVSVAYDQNNGDGGYLAAAVDAGHYQLNSDEPIMAVGVTYTTDLFNAGFVFEKEDDMQIINLVGGFNYGAGSIYGVVALLDDGDDSGVDFALGTNYNLASNFYVYGEVAMGNDKMSAIGDLSIVTLGASYGW